MRIRYQELAGKHTVTADGETLGRVVDLVAEPRGDALRVTALLVGPSALMRRIGFKRRGFVRRAPARRVPWRLVARIEEHAVRLRVSRDALDKEEREDVARATSEDIETVEPNQ